MAKKINHKEHREHRDTERYCFLCALCGYKPFQEIIKSLMAVVNNFLYDSLAKVDLQPFMMFFLSKHVVDS